MATSALINHTSTNAQKSSTEYLLDSYLTGSWTSAAGRRGEQSTCIRATVLITRIALPPICIGRTRRNAEARTHTSEQPRRQAAKRICSDARLQKSRRTESIRRRIRATDFPPRLLSPRTALPPLSAPPRRAPVIHSSTYIDQYIDSAAGVFPAKPRICISFPPEQCSLQQQQQQRPELHRMRPATYIHLHRPRQ